MRDGRGFEQRGFVAYAASCELLLSRTGRPALSTVPEQVRLYVPQAAFEAAVELVARFRETGTVRLFVGPTAFRPPLTFMVEEQDPDLRSALAERSLSLGEFANSFFDIIDVLSAQLVNVDEDGLVKARTSSSRWEDGEVEDADVARAKYRLVADAFDIPDLQHRLWVKETSKNDLAAQVTWEVVAKEADEVRPLPEGATSVRYAVLKLRAEAPYGGGGFAGARRSRETTMTVDYEDVTYLIGSLTRLQDALRRRSDGSGP